jgi:hypothetical protein
MGRGWEQRLDRRPDGIYHLPFSAVQIQSGHDDVGPPPGRWAWEAPGRNTGPTQRPVDGHLYLRVPHRPQRGVVERGPGVDRRIPRRQQQLVALPQRQLQWLGQPDGHRSARRRRPPLDVAHLALGRPGPGGEVELAQASPGPAAVELVTEPVRLVDRHGGHAAPCDLLRADAIPWRESLTGSGTRATSPSSCPADRQPTDHHRCDRYGGRVEPSVDGS